MRRILLAGFVVSLSFILSSCSFGVSFIIENNSNLPVMVKYQVKQKHFEVPRIKNIDDLKDKEILWEKLSEEKYKIDRENGFVELMLLPNQALHLLRMDSRSINDESIRDSFEIKQLSIIGENGSIEVKGNQVFEIFEPQKAPFRIFSFGPDISDYVLRYKESPKTEL